MPILDGMPFVLMREEGYDPLILKRNRERFVDVFRGSSLRQPAAVPAAFQLGSGSRARSVDAAHTPLLGWAARLHTAAEVTIDPHSIS